MTQLRVIARVCILGLLVIFNACTEDQSLRYSRDPWIFRINLDNIPRVLVVALSDELWAAYDVEHAKLYKTWKGGINFNGPMYDDRHNVQPSTRGVSYTTDTLRSSPWMLSVNGKISAVNAEYLGYIIKKGVASIQYKIPAGNGKNILINETPAYTTGKDEAPQFTRKFETLNVPDDTEVLLLVAAGALHTPENVNVKGGMLNRTTINALNDKGIKTYKIKGTAKLKKNGVTEIAFSHQALVINIKTSDTNEPSIANQDVQPEDYVDHDKIVEEGKLLIGRNDCGACHSIDKKAIGPSYKMIAAKYSIPNDDIGMLADKVIKGGTGVWGRQMMTPHPLLSKNESESMITYILSLDSGSRQNLSSGLAANFFKPGIQLSRIPEFIPGQKPNLSVVVPDVEFVGIDMSINRETNDFFGFDDQFVMHISGYMNVEEQGKYEFRLKANAGARFILNGKKIAEVNYSNYDYHEQEVSAQLNQGLNPIRIEYYEDIYSSNLSLRWRRPGENKYARIPEKIFSYDPADIQPVSPGIKEVYEVNAPGFGTTVDGVHPSFDITTVRPEGFNKRLSDLEFLPDGSLAVSTWDSSGNIYIIDGVLGSDRSKMKTHLFATGLYEVMGLEYVDGKLHVLQKWELTILNDTDGDKVADEYLVGLDDWTASANFHEWAFGLLYRDGYFYFNTGISLGGNGILTDSGVSYIDKMQTKDRGKTLKVKKSDWTFEAIAHGYKAPNGIGFGVDGEIFSTDNEGHMVPTNKLMHVSGKGYPFFGNDEVLKELSLPVPEFKPPVLWMPTSEVSNSPSQPVTFRMGPFQEGHMVFGDVHHGGLQRVFVEKVKGEYQGAIFRFTQGLEAGINRLSWGPDGNLYMAGLGAGGDFGHKGQCCGLQRLSYNGRSTLDIISVRAKMNGMEIEFTEPLRTGDGIYNSDYTIQQFWYETAEDVPEGGVKNDIETLSVRSVNIAPDRKKVFLEIDGMKKEHVVYIKINKPFISETGNRLWAGETWYTLNNIPDEKGIPGMERIRKNNQLTDEEKLDGWKLLSDEKILKEGVLFSNREYKNFELEFDWKAANGADGGVYYKVPGDISPANLTGYPEMQIVDEFNNAEAGKDITLLSGALYKIKGPKYKLSRPDAFNHSRLIVKDSHVEHWLNGIKVTQYELDSSELKSLPGRVNEKGFKSKGHIVLAVQEQTIHFRNIRIRER